MGVSGIYNRFKANLMNKEVDLIDDTVYVSLYDINHAFTATDTVYTTTNELPTLGGYTLGGAELQGKSVTEAATTYWTGSDRDWTAATFTAYAAVLWDDTVATDDLICSIDFGGPQTVTSGTFTIQWHVNGIISLA
jgi:hypothetical protein